MHSCCLHARNAIPERHYGLHPKQPYTQSYTLICLRQTQCNRFKLQSWRAASSADFQCVLALPARA
uniref:Uncharacterized protein n=1 Tax=Anguilla anguilla TaxID=7936 RepID=A0A0E9UPK6_ANGAN